MHDRGQFGDVRLYDEQSFEMERCEDGKEG